MTRKSTQVLFSFLLCVAVNFIAEITTAQIITTIAGNDTFGFTGDGIPATATKLASPLGVSVDKNGNIYICDYGNYRLRKINNSGLIFTVVGNGTGGYTGDEMSATTAEIDGPWGVDIDTAGNLYLADDRNYRVRKIDVTGIIYTVAGTGTLGYGADNIPATTSDLNLTRDVAVDSSGDIYIADAVNNRIRKVTSGIIYTVAGSGSAGYSGDGLAATAAKLNTPNRIALDGKGNLYIMMS